MSINKITPLDTFVSNDAPICYGILKPGDHYEGGIPVIKVKNIIGGVILEDDLLKTTPEIHAQYKRAEVKEGDILLTIRGTTGRVAIVPNSLNGANITQDTARIRVSSNDDSLYIFYALQSFNVQQQITLNTVGQAVKGINIAEVKKLKIYHPILDEQKAIAQILSTWDQAISATEKLLENSQQQKKALMQQLLTGKKRLFDENGVEFSDEWQRFSLGSIAKVYQPKTISQSELSSDGYPVYGANGIIGYYSDFNHELEQIAVTCRGSTCGVVNWTLPKSWITGNAMVINVDGSVLVDKKFLFYVLGFSDLKYLITGSGQPQITGDIKNHVVSLAPIEEQKSIAYVLTLADQEIGILQKKLDCLKQEKKALMQQLLTGKKRVKVAA
jgi:type I restriction enzyme S subunit